MDELRDLLAQADQIGEMSREDAEQYRDDLRAAADDVIEAGVDDDATLELLDQAATTIEAAQARMDALDAEAEERSQRVASIAERIRGEQREEGDGEGEGEGAEGDGDAGEGDGAEGGDATGGDGAEAEDDGEGAEGERQAVAASGQRRSGITRQRVRRPDLMEAQRRRQRANGGNGELSLVAAANLGSVQAGTPLTPETLAQAMIEAYRLSEGYRGPRVKVPVARIGARGGDPAELYGEERTLRMGSPEANTAKVAAVTSVSSLTAAGGICAPTPVRYDLPAVGVDDRPVRDDLLARFGADRGGIRTLPPPELTDFTGAVAAWTEANDQNPTSPTTKPCLTMTCPTEEETLVDAITRCLKIGNFRARFFPEQVQTWIEQAAVWHARFAETRMLTAIGSGSTQVSSGQLLGAMPDTVATIVRATAAFRSRRRLGAQRLRWGIPFWLLNLLTADLARQMPRGGSLEEQYAVAEAELLRIFSALGLNVTTFLDGETGQVFGAQGDGPLIGWPSTVVTYLFPEGSWLFLDGGQLDLGIVRDSTLVGTNDYLVFAETFENVHFHGIESHRLTLDLCPDGSVAGTVDVNPCTVGS